MGLAVETLGFFATNPGTTFTAVTMASGDNNRVREFTQSTDCRLQEIFYQHATSGAVRVFSAVMHDPVRGITILTSETPFHQSIQPYRGDPMASGDTLTIQVTGGTAETDVGALTLYYQDVLGIAARLYQWADVRGAIEHLKPLEVDCTPNGTAGNWSDTAFNATEDLLKADRKYAVLGYLTDTAVAAIGVKGGETGNVRIAGPGAIESEVTSEWYVRQSLKHELPQIPVISANNKGSTFVNIITTATSGTVKVTVMLALLTAGFA